MNTVVVNGKNYVKARDIARDLGYTADYVGQLCRAEKVDAQLVGRSWYVNKESLQAHKRDRYRSNTQETIKHAQRTLKAEEAANDTHKVSVHFQAGDRKSKTGYASESSYVRADAPDNRTTYQTDEAELIPGTVKDVAHTGTIRVNLADAQSVEINSQEKTYDFDPTQRQQLRFKGKLSVMGMEDEPEVTGAGTHTTQAIVDQKEVFDERIAKKSFTEEVSELKDSKAKRNIDKKAIIIKTKHRRPTTKQKKRALPLEHNPEGILSMQRGSIVGRNPVGGTLRIDADPVVQQVSSGRRTFLMITTTLIALILGVLVTSVEQTATITNDDVVVRYTLDFENIVAAAYDVFVSEY